jgi:hypothetical protein
VTTSLFEFGFVPASALTRHMALSQPSTRILEPERTGLWDRIAFPDSLVECLDKLSPDSCLINASQMRWGDGSASFIDVFVEGDRLVNVSVTLDLRASCLKFVSDLTLIANRHDWLVITTDGRVFRPTVRRFLVEIQHSPAMRWIRGSMDSFVRRQLTPRNDELRFDSDRYSSPDGFTPSGR